MNTYLKLIRIILLRLDFIVQSRTLPYDLVRLVARCAPDL